MEGFEGWVKGIDGGEGFNDGVSFGLPGFGCCENAFGVPSVFEIDFTAGRDFGHWDDSFRG